MLFSQMTGRIVVDPDTAETTAKVTGVRIAPSPPHITHITALTVDADGRQRRLPWPDIHAIGPDAVIAKLTAVPAPPSTVVETDPVGKVLLTETGRQLGIVQDGEFDEADGHLIRILTAGTAVDGQELLGAGHYAVVVAPVHHL
ncbi:hypothetical protein [Streptacidiphilus anmyonensis]|uniref:hypothetical protein n=1 Tax=Streptacidiphilus anmyonensis TaxID=405782 RepID=UPI0005A7AC25|nr:hypothetical protein [Streptacidiphilus anmyonensis]